VGEGFEKAYPPEPAVDCAKGGKGKAADTACEKARPAAQIQGYEVNHCHDAQATNQLCLAGHANRACCNIDRRQRQQSERCGDAEVSGPVSSGQNQRLAQVLPQHFAEVTSPDVDGLRKMPANKYEKDTPYAAGVNVLGIHVDTM
jgi:hypothetical protein